MRRRIAHVGGDHTAHRVADYDGFGDREVLEEAEDVFGDDGNGGFFAIGLGAAGVVVVEDYAAVGGQVGEDGEVVVLC